MWEILTKTIEDHQNNKFSDNSRNSLYDITTASYFIDRANQNIDSYLGNYNSTSVSLDFYKNKLFLFSLKYYRDNKNTPENEKIEIEKLISLGCLLGDLDDKIMKGKNIEKYQDQMKQCLMLIKKGVDWLLLQEIKRWDLFSILPNVENKKAYLSHISSIPEVSGEFDKISYLINFIDKNIN